MSTDITISAVGDFLMKTRIINSARLAGDNNYSFDKIFEQVAPYLRDADYTIGNLETTFSGAGRNPTKATIDKTYSVVRRNPRTGWPMFNCPDQFADTLKNLGFDAVSTANNHCMDCGINGLKRTLDVLDRVGIAHTGTYRTEAESQRYLIQEVKGIRIGVLAYTKTTNKIPVPARQAWAVNLIQPGKIASDIKKLKAQKVDLVIVCIHVGREYSMWPVERQKQLTQMMLRSGADIILGAHSHVIQPALFYQTKDSATKQKFAIYSLGNFVSTRLYRNDHTLTGLITRLSIRKEDDGTIRIMKAECIPTWTRISRIGPRSVFRVLPLGETVRSEAGRRSGEWARMKASYEHVKKHLKYHCDAPEIVVL